MAAAYQPQPGTIPAKVIAHLRSLPPGTRLRTAELVDTLGLEIGQSASLRNYLEAAVNHGVIVRHPDPIDKRRSLWWLGDGTPPELQKVEGEETVDAPLQRRPHKSDTEPQQRIDQLVAGAPAVTAPIEKPTPPAKKKASSRVVAKVEATAGTALMPEQQVTIRQVSIETDPSGLDQHEPGAKLDAGKIRAGLVLGGFARALTEVSKVGTYGAAKYTEAGWTQVAGGIDRYDDAGMRHWLAEHAGQRFDPDTELMHAAHAAWNALARLDLMLRERETITTTKD